MQLIEEYMKLSREERKSHLDLSTPCIERGGPKDGGLSYICKGLLAHMLDTTIPSGLCALVCHACNNSNCSNPTHLYWGTSSDNAIDVIESGGDSPYQRTVDKYGLEKAKEMFRQYALNGVAKGGAAGKGKPKSPEHRRKISESLRKRKKQTPGGETLVYTPDSESGAR